MSETLGVQLTVVTDAQAVPSSEQCLLSVAGKEAGWVTHADSRGTTGTAL